MNLFEKIEAIARLPDGWNHHHAPKFSDSVLSRARSIATVLNGCGFDCFPTANQSIQFEKTVGWEYLEIEVFSDRIETYNETESRLTNGVADTCKGVQQG